jgi:hypothetical protein
MKRYLVFTFHTYYPIGGMDDFLGDFDTLDEASAALVDKVTGQYYYEAHIYDSADRKIVFEYETDDDNVAILNDLIQKMIEGAK